MFITMYQQVMVVQRMPVHLNLTYWTVEIIRKGNLNLNAKQAEPGMKCYKRVLAEHYVRNVVSPESNTPRMHQMHRLFHVCDDRTDDIHSAISHLESLSSSGTLPVPLSGGVAWYNDEAIHAISVYLQPIVYTLCLALPRLV
jgi:hypothetical protein